MHPPIAVGRQMGNHCLELGHQFAVGQRGPTNPLWVVPADAPPGWSERPRSPLPRSPSRTVLIKAVMAVAAAVRAPPLRISTSSGFLPSRRWVRALGCAKSDNQKPARPLGHRAAVRLPCATGQRQAAAGSRQRHAHEPSGSASCGPAPLALNRRDDLNGIPSVGHRRLYASHLLSGRPCPVSLGAI